MNKFFLYVNCHHCSKSSILVCSYWAISAPIRACADTATPEGKTWQSPPALLKGSYTMLQYSISFVPLLKVVRLPSQSLVVSCLLKFCQNFSDGKTEAFPGHCISIRGLLTHKIQMYSLRTAVQMHIHVCHGTNTCGWRRHLHSPTKTHVNSHISMRSVELKYQRHELVSLTVCSLNVCSRQIAGGG